MKSTDYKICKEEIDNYSKNRTDISDHLLTIFTESYNKKPKLIVELGVRGGESSYVFGKVAKIFNAYHIGVDIDYCLEQFKSKSNYEKSYFIHCDDIETSNNWYKICNDIKLPKTIDILFIDTSHMYNHTLLELESWVKYLSDDGLIIFHDTNLNKVLKFKDGSSLDCGWDNQRGVIRAVNDYFGILLDETKESYDIINTKNGVWYYNIVPYSSGLLIMHKVKNE